MKNLDTKIKKLLQRFVYVLVYTFVAVWLGVMFWETSGMREPVKDFFEGDPIVVERQDVVEPSTEADKVIEAYMESIDGQNQLRLWAEKKYLEEQSIEIERRKEELREKELSLI